MSVYTKVTPSQLADWLKRYSVGTLTELRGIAAGIENTNYFVTTSLGRYVLTLFERLPERSLPFYLGLMAHLARQGTPCSAPIVDHANGLYSILNGKPATLVTRLAGAPVMSPTPAHCTQLGAVLAEMHVAGQSFAISFENPRGPKWWRDTAPLVAPFLDAAQRQLLDSELEFQSRYRFQDLPRGPIHADLFRDNVLWDDERVGGLIDFYFAGVDAWLFDAAVTLNDWCTHSDGDIDRERAIALLGAYHAVRPFTAIERGAWPAMLRAASLRFWLSRLHDFHLPRPGELVHAHDPEHFRRILELRIRDAHDLPWVA
jgi:homoserine kinase type II